MKLTPQANERSGPPPSLIVAMVVAISLVAAQVVRIMSIAASDPSQGIQSAIITLAITGAAIVFGFVALVLISVPAATRAKSLRTQNPGAVVVTLWKADELTAAFRRLNNGTVRENEPVTALISAILDDSGISFVTGEHRHYVQLAMCQWNEIARLEMGRAIAFNQSRPAINLTLTRDSLTLILPMVVANDAFGGLLSLSKARTEAFLHEVELFLSNEHTKK